MENLKGRIFNIQRFSVHDGEGIRTIVFFKGCYLRCRWCCNPESQNREIETMYENGVEKIVGRDVTVDEIMPEIRADAQYYRRSGGGVTLSGGEMLCQADFAAELLKTCKEEGFNTAVESTACASEEKIRKVLPYIDNWLLDIKSMDNEKHKEYTGASNAQILKNAKILGESPINLIIRTPVIPTFNDTEEDISAIAEFIKNLNSATAYHLLPYHRLGLDKYAKLKRTYSMKDILPPTDEKMKKLLEVAKKSGLDCRIGG